jgi:hypothetical protein
MLKKLQQNFASDILDNKNLSGQYVASDFSETALMNIYHNNYFLSLIAALKASYSCVFRLVGEDFFEFLAKEYIIKNSPSSGDLQDYGDNFYRFIAKFPPCEKLPYLSDIAKFERYYEMCYHRINQEFTISSAYPILDIWRLDENSDTIDITKGGQKIHIIKINNQVIVKLETLKGEKYGKNL